MENENFREERERLNYVLDYIDETLFSETPSEENLRQYIIEERRRIWNDYSLAPDSTDLMQANQTLEMDTERYFRIKDKLYFLQQTRNSPYFARIDFQENGASEAEKFYIGALSLIDRRTYEILVCDWRADISSLYYDGTLGPAEYRCEEGLIQGDISLRRQIKIEDGELKYVFDNGINITDPILMETLGKSSDAKLKTVINTIQKEQNRVIRDMQSDLLLVQGSAGSGKTSVALHRIAFLLYRFRKSVSAQDIIIFSPNEIFSSYIAEVLPDLGEENAVRTDLFHFLVNSESESEIHYVDRSEQIESLLQCKDSSLRNMIAKKGTTAFAEEIRSFYNDCYSSVLITENVVCFDQILATAEELNQWFSVDYASYPPRQRTDKIISRVLDTAEDLKEEICRVFLDEASQHGILAFTDEEKAEQCAEMWDSAMAEIRARITGLCMIVPEVLYLDFLKQYDEDLYAYTQSLFAQSIVPYEDLLCLSWIKYLAGTLLPMRTVKQVVVDEGQDYPELAYCLLNGLFPLARFTVLGDVAQQVDEKVSSIAEIARCFPEKKNVVSYVLDKGYRSTVEITEFANRFRSGGDEVRMIERHGQVVRVEKFTEPRQIKEILEGYQSRGCTTNMILCRTQRECDELYLKLRSETQVLRMRSFDTFTPNTTVILPIYLAKGLEADGVIIVGDTAQWNTEEDRNLLYVAATRPLHELTVLYETEPGEILS